MRHNNIEFVIANKSKTHFIIKPYIMLYIYIYRCMKMCHFTKTLFNHTTHTCIKSST